MNAPQSNDLGSRAAFPSHGPLIPGDFAGLTKRELFAAMAMQGIAATWDGHNYGLAERSVQLADALLAALKEVAP